jgi:hypothetical protein
MTQVERRQARLRMIQARTSYNLRPAVDDDTIPSPEVHHVLGKTENFPISLSSFGQDNQDPATKVWTDYCLFIDYC